MCARLRRRRIGDGTCEPARESRVAAQPRRLPRLRPHELRRGASGLRAGGGRGPRPALRECVGAGPVGLGFPGTLAMATCGSPRSTGVYYDVSWDNDLSPAGSNCATRGALVPFNQTINVNTNAGDSVADINPAKLPRDPDDGCARVYPHQYLRA